jgi:hypothetical protein
MIIRYPHSLIAVSLALGSLAAPCTALAHGTMTTPTSRVYACFQGDPENPTNPACAAAKAVGGDTLKLVSREMVQLLGHQDPTTSDLLKRILAVEEEHADELSDLLDGLPGNEPR